MSPEKLRIGIVGCGRVSRTAHYGSLKQHEQYYDFKAVCDIDHERADFWAKENGVNAYYSLTDMLKNEELDIVSICVPNGLHAKLGMQVAQAGLHVLVEKPLAMTLEDADALIDTCEDAGVKLFNVKQNRYNATNKILKACVDKGRFGRITSITVTLSWHRELPYYLEDHKWRMRRDLSGGVFTNQAVHYIDMLQWMAGAPPETVYAKMGTTFPIEVEDYGSAIIKFKNGIIGTLVLTNHSFPNDTEGSIVIIGEKGQVKIGGTSMNKVEYWQFAEPAEEDELIKEADTAPPTVYGFGHIELYERVARYLLFNEGEEDIIDGREGRKSVAIMEALYLSDKTGQEIRFPIGKR